MPPQRCNMKHAIERNVVYDGEVVSKAKFEIDTDYPDVVGFHHDVYKWSGNIYKWHLGLLLPTKKAFKAKGFKKFVCSISVDDERADKAIKYWRLFGFSVYKTDVLGPELYVGELEL